VNETVINLTIAILLLAANAFYVAAEFALVKSRGFRIDALAEKNEFGARLIKHILTRVEAYLANCQLGITMASLGLGWIGEPTVSALIAPLLIPLGLPESAVHVVAFFAGFLLFSSLHIVLGEQVPKTFAIRRPEPVSQFIAYPLHISYILLFPLTWVLNTASSGILRLLGVAKESHQEILTDEEIEGLIEVSAEHGKMEAGQAAYIQNVFRFGELEVSDVMVHRTRIVALDASLPTEALIKAVLESPYTRMPLYHDEPDNIVGIVHAKDVLRALIRTGGDIGRIDMQKLVTKPWFVPDTTPLSAQLNAFLKAKTHFALVIDEYGEMEGLITLEDILEEIVGEISDEYDEVIQGIIKQADGSYLIDGDVPIRDVNRSLGWHMPEEEATTIAGLVIHEAQSIPNEGQQFTFYGFRFRVLRKQRNRLTQLRVTPLKAA
jgi:CBS domain containing-hemolysin-like protein